jgi:DNA-binding transcriptional LysR family regulator
VWLAPRIREFLELYPDIRVSILTDDDELDLGMREADCAIRMNPPRQADLVQRHLLRSTSTSSPAPTTSRSTARRRRRPISTRTSIIVYGEDPRPPFPAMNWLLRPGRSRGTPREPGAARQQRLRHPACGRRTASGSRPSRTTWRRRSSKIVQVLPELRRADLRGVLRLSGGDCGTRSASRCSRDFLVRKVAETQF